MHQPAPAVEPAGAKIISILRGLWTYSTDGTEAVLDVHRRGTSYCARIRRLESEVWAWQLDVHRNPASRAGDVTRVGDYAISLEAAQEAVELRATVA